MTELKKKRLAFLRYVLAAYGIESKDDVFDMSLHDVAHNLNNIWYSRHFLTEEKMNSVPYGTMDRSLFALRSYDLHLLYPSIRSTIRNVDTWDLCCGNNKVEYLTWYRIGED